LHDTIRTRQGVATSVGACAQMSEPLPPPPLKLHMKDAVKVTGTLPRENICACAFKAVLSVPAVCSDCCAISFEASGVAHTFNSVKFSDKN
jgi:hypothetical protein